jgi:hypothetical protein
MIIDHRVEPSPAIQNPMTKTIVRFPNNQTLFIRLIIRTFQLVFSAGTVFFSRNKPTNNVFQPAYQHSRTGKTVTIISLDGNGIIHVCIMLVHHSTNIIGKFQIQEYIFVHNELVSASSVFSLGLMQAC